MPIKTDVLAQECMDEMLDLRARLALQEFRRHRWLASNKVETSSDSERKQPGNGSPLQPSGAKDIATS